MEDTNQVQTIDLDTLDAGLVQEHVEINPEANPMAAPPPPDDGIYRVKLIAGDSWDHKETKKNKAGESRAYLATQFSAQILADGTQNNNKRVFGRVNTLTFDGKNEMAYILIQVYGGTPEAKARVTQLDNYVKLAQAFKAALAGEPVIRLSTKWVARYNAGTKEEPDYKTAKSGQKNFPQLANGTFNHIIDVPKFGEVAAQAVIQDYFPDVA